MFQLIKEPASTQTGVNLSSSIHLRKLIALRPRFLFDSPRHLEQKADYRTINDFSFAKC
jgi:hypothetical protein